MEKLELILEIKKSKDFNLKNIVSFFIERKISKYEAFILIRNNFNYDHAIVMYYINLLYKDDEPNPFNEDFVNFSGDD